MEGEGDGKRSALAFRFFFSPPHHRDPRVLNQDGDKDRYELTVAGKIMTGLKDRGNY